MIIILVFFMYEYFGFFVPVRLCRTDMKILILILRHYTAIHIFRRLFKFLMYYQSNATPFPCSRMSKEGGVPCECGPHLFYYSQLFGLLALKFVWSNPSQGFSSPPKNIFAAK